MQAQPAGVKFLDGRLAVFTQLVFPAFLDDPALPA
jgi:hypothetical protein